MEAETKIKRNKQQRLATDGFLADPDKPVWENVQHLLSKALINKPTNMACRNLTTTKKSPTLAKHLLSLGLNFAIKNKQTTNNIEATITRFTDDLQQKYFIANNKDDFDPNDDNYKPRLYERSTWVPPPGSTEGKKCINNFALDLRKAATMQKK